MPYPKPPSPPPPPPSPLLPQVVSECERARIELGQLLTQASTTLTSPHCLGDTKADPRLQPLKQQCHTYVPCTQTFTPPH